jgi:3-hydroxy-9,10-secoandrosta-1,3,5(10)-triene-9,17-dione monooxygenase reductase component
MGTGFDEARFREALGHFATGVVIVTGIDASRPYGFTCQAFASLSLDPPMVALAPGKTSTSWPPIARSGSFCANVLSEGQEALCRDFAATGGDKFTGVGWHPGSNGAPILEGVLAWVECTIAEVHDAGDHDLVFGKVEDMGVNGGKPLLYYRGGFGTFSP